jgi:hypothetical protein
MTSIRLTLLICVVIAGTGLARAQDAQAVIDASARVYAEARAYSVEADSRLLQFVFAPMCPVRCINAWRSKCANRGITGSRRKR